MGAAWEVATEVGEGAGILGKVLPFSTSGRDIFWSRYISAFGANGAEARGSACAFTAAGHREKVKAGE